MPESQDKTGLNITPEEQANVVAARYAGQFKATDADASTEKYSAQFSPVAPDSITVPSAEAAPVRDSADMIDDEMLGSQPPTLMGGPAEYEQVLLDVEETLRSNGSFSEQDIEQVLRPGDQMEYAVNPATVARMYTAIKPVLGQNHEHLAAAAELFGELEKQGLDRDENMNWSVIRALTDVYTQENLLGLSTLSRWQKQISRKVGEDFALMKPMLFNSWNGGLGLLDAAGRATNAFRIGLSELTGRVSPEEKYAMQMRFLPPARLVNPRTGEADFYATTAGAQHDLRWKHFTGTVQWMWHSGLSQGAKVLQNDEWVDYHQAAAEASKTDAIDAANMMPQIAGFGTFPGGMGIVEHLEAFEEPETVAKLMTDPYLTTLGMSMGEEERQALIAEVEEQGALWPVWREINDRDEVGLETVLELTAMNTGYEVAVDPFIIGADVPVGVVNQLRRLSAKVAPAAAARVTAKVARATEGLGDAKAALSAAEENLRRVRGRAAKAAEDNGGIVPSQHVEDTVKAQRAVIIEADNVDGLSGTRKLTDNELEVMQRSGRRNPKVLPRTYRSKTVKRIEMRQGPLTEGEAVERTLKVARHEEAVVKAAETSRSPAKTVGALEPKRLEPKWRGPRMVKDIEIEAKTVDEVATELEAMRRRELTRDTDWALEYQREQDGAISPLTQQRMLFGPDDMEQAGDAFNHLVRTGGEGIDDVYITPPHAEYSWDPAKVTSQLEWSMVDDVTKTEAKLGMKRGVTQLSLDESALRVVARQEDRIRRALGASRRIGDKARVAVLEEELKAASKVTKKLSKGMKKDAKKAAIEADTRWTGGQPTSLRKAGKLEQWIKDMPYRFQQGLYPDSYHLTSDGKLGQLFAPIRAPIRWLETYHPQMAEQMRLSMARYDQHVMASQEIFHNVFERAGVITRSKTGKMTLNKERSELLYDLLDTRTGAKEHLALVQKADDKLLAAHGEIRKLLDDFADQQGLTGTSRYLEGYMRHAFDGVEMTDGSRPLEFLGLSGKAEVFVSHLMRRKNFGQAGKKVDKDLVMIMDIYNRAARRKQFMEPMYHDLIQTGLELNAKHGHTRFGNYMKMTVDALQGKRSVLGKVADHVTGAKVKPDGTLAQTGMKRGERVLTGLTTLAWMSSIPGNSRYLLMQAAAAVSTTAGRFGLYRTTQGMLRMMTKEGQIIARKLGFFDTVTDMMETNALREWADLAGTYTGINQAEATVRGMSAHAAMDMMMSQLGHTTWREAVQAGHHHRIMFNGLRAAENANHAFGPASRTPIINRVLGQPVGSAMTQFTLYPLKQMEELVSMANSNPGYVARYMMVSGYISRLAATAAGYDATQWTGVGFMDEVMEQGIAGGPESPLSDLLSRWMEVSDSMSGGDPRAVEQAAAYAVAGLQTFIPVLLRDIAKQRSRIENEAAFDTKRRKVRDLYLGENPNIVDRLAEGLDPGLGERPDPAPGLGGDLVPTLMMGPSIRDRIQRVTSKGAYEKKNRDIVGMKELYTDLADALEAGSQDGAKLAVQTLAQRYGVRINVDQLKDRTASILMARRMSANMRYLLENPQHAAEFLQLLETTGAGSGQ